MGSPSSTAPSTSRPSGNRSVRRPVASSQAGRICISSGQSLPFTSRPSSFTIQNRRSPTTPERLSSTVSGWIRPSDLTGAMEMRFTRLPM